MLLGKLMKVKASQSLVKMNCRNIIVHLLQVFHHCMLVVFMSRQLIVDRI